MSDYVSVEIVASECHNQWAGWMKFLFIKCETKV